MAEKRVELGRWALLSREDGSVVVHEGGSQRSDREEALVELSHELGLRVGPRWNVSVLSRRVYEYVEEMSRLLREGGDSGSLGALKSESGKGGDGAKIRVFARNQYRAALGIVQAYRLLHPKASLSALRRAFPKTLNPNCGVDELFVLEPEARGRKDERFPGYFMDAEDVIVTGVGERVCVAVLWDDASFKRLVSRAGEYGIVVADGHDDESIAACPGYRLDYLNGFVPAAAGKGRMYLWIIVVILLLLLLGLLLYRSCTRCEPVAPVVVAPAPVEQVEVAPAEPVVEAPVERIEEIEKDFNAAQFALADTKLNEAAKATLRELAEELKKFPEVKLRVVGHSSSEGNADFNRKLSYRRAQSAVDFLIGEGIAAERLMAEGKGSSEPVDPTRLDVNRRVEFIIVE